MKKDSPVHTSQDHDRKHQHDHIESNPRAAKDLPNAEDSEGSAHISPETAELIAKGHAITNKPSSQSAFIPDQRDLIRKEDTAHFTNRAAKENK